MQTRLAMVASLALAATGAAAQPAFERVFIDAFGAAAAEPLKLEAFVFRPRGVISAPVAIISHGSDGGRPKQSQTQGHIAAELTALGYVVVVPMRRGRGASGGVSREYEDKRCDAAAWAPGLADALDDMTAAIAYAHTIDKANADDVTLVGVSRGGFLSVAYAARGAERARIRRVVNFVGAWVAQAEDQCPQDFNQSQFKAFGAETRMPMLWLYGKGDKMNTDEMIERYAGAFLGAGGQMRLRLVPGVPGNGHALPGFPQLWRRDLITFLARR